MVEVANYRFLDYDGLLVYHNELEKLFDKKLDKQQDAELHGGDFMMVNNVSGLLEPRPIGDLGLVDDVTVDTRSVLDGRVAKIDLATPLSKKQDSLSEDELAVLAGEPFTTDEQTKLAGIATGAQVNAINSISVNGTVMEPDVDKKVAITTPTTLAELDPTGFTYVGELTAVGSNVHIEGTAPNFTIRVDALEMPDEFTSEETPEDVVIGDPLTDMDATKLEPIKTGAILTEGDVVIFSNNIQAVVTSIEYDEFEEEKPVEFDAIVTRIPAEVSFSGIKGNPMSNTELYNAFYDKMNTSMDNAALPLGVESINLGRYLFVGAGGAVEFGEIVKIPNQLILALFGIVE